MMDRAATDSILPSAPRVCAPRGGLYLSRDAGKSFLLLDGREPATAVAFDTAGKRLRYARALSNEVVEAALDGRVRGNHGRPRRDR